MRFRARPILWAFPSLTTPSWEESSRRMGLEGRRQVTAATSWCFLLSPRMATHMWARTWTSIRATVTSVSAPLGFCQAQPG